MSLALDAPKENFRLSMLVYDTRYRSYTIQIAVLLLLLLFIGWLTDNTIKNLAERGKDINFSFLWQRAGYDISQTMIPYSNDDTHARAALVGILNTLLVAIVGVALLYVALSGLVGLVSRLRLRSAYRAA